MFNIGRFNNFFRVVLNFDRKGFSTSSFLQSRLQTIRDRSVRQQIDWIMATNPIKHANRTDSTVYRDQCKIPFKLPHTEPEETDLLDDINKSSYQGNLEEMVIDYFGSITAEHGDILNETGDCLIVPIPPNLTPHYGFGLRVLELGGKKLIKALVQRSKLIISERVKELESMKASFKDQNEYKSSLLEARTLQIGDVILTPTFGSSKCKLLAFMITPYYWQGNSREAALRLRETVKKSLDHLNFLKITNVLMTHVGESLHGYRPKDGCEIMVEEAYETILQVDKVVPNYHLKSVRFIDKDLETSRTFAHAIFKIRQEKLPEFQVVPAPVYYSRNSARIIEIDESVLKFSSQYRKITYKRHSVVRRSKRLHYLRNLKPFLWRGSRLYDPPPFLLFKSTGLPSVFQLPPRPYYKRGVSHVLFPFYSNGIKAMKMTGSGKWVGVAKKKDIYTTNIQNQC
uniref:Macro domain-containing protein n=1 Tax=Theileria annulata TaxID=5874 RepID=A0A3B0MTQ4_THEAN